MSTISIARKRNVFASSDPVNLYQAVTLDEIMSHLVGHTIEMVERELIVHTLIHYCGSRTRSATILGISIRCLRNKIREYEDLGIDVPAPGERACVEQTRN